MDAIAGPLITAAEGFEDQQRLAKLTTVFERPIYGEIAGEPPSGNHPIKDVRPLWANGCVIGFANANRWNW